MTGQQMTACLIDCCLVAILFLAAFFPLLFVEPNLIVVLVLLPVFVLFFCAFYLAYAATFDSFWRRTLGKALCGIAVNRE